MKQPAAFRGTYSDWRLVKTRGVIQIVFEVPLADERAVYEVLGGMPDVARERWFGIAAINIGKEAMPDQRHVQGQPSARPQPNPQAGAKRDWRDIPPPQRAGIRVNEALFAAFLREERPDDWHETGDADGCLKLICKIDSKRDLAVNHKALLMFNLLDSAFDAWKAKERVVA